MGDTIKIILLAILLILSVFTSPTTSTDHSNPKTLGIVNPIHFDEMESSQSYDAVIFNDVAVIADGYAGLRFVNISDPTSPREVKLISFDDSISIEHIELYGDIIIASGNEIVVGFRIAQPDDPEKLFAIDEYAESTTLVDHYLYVGGKDILRVYQLSPSYTNPTLKVSVPLVDVAKGMLSIDNSLFISEYGSGLSSFDISNRGNPTFLNRINVTDAAHELRIYQDTLFVSDTSRGGISLVDVSDPMNPVLQGNFDITGIPKGIDLVGTTLYVSTTRDGILRLDVSDPGSPLLIDRYEPVTTNYTEQLYLSSDIVVGDGVAVVSMEQYGYHIFSTSNPMQFLSVVDPDSAEFTSVKQSDKLVFAASKYDGILIYNKTTGTGLQQIGLLPINELNERFVTSIEVVEDHLYIVGGSMVYIYQFWNNGTTNYVNSINSNVYDGIMKIVDNHTLILSQSLIVESYDISNRSTLDLQWTWQSSSQSPIRDLVKIDDMIAVVQHSGYVHFLNYSTSGEPPVEQSIVTGESLISGAYFNGSLYLGVQYGTMLLYNITDLNNPDPLEFDQLDFYHGVSLMEVNRETLFMYTYSGLETFNLTASPYLTEGSIYRDIGDLNSMSVYDDMFFGSKGYHGFLSGKIGYSFCLLPPQPSIDGTIAQSSDDPGKIEFELGDSNLLYSQISTVIILAILVRKKYYT